MQRKWHYIYEGNRNIRYKFGLNLNMIQRTNTNYDILKLSKSGSATKVAQLGLFGERGRAKELGLSNMPRPL